MTERHRAAIEQARRAVRASHRDRGVPPGDEGGRKNLAPRRIAALVAAVTTPIEAQSPAPHAGEPADVVLALSEAAALLTHCAARTDCLGGCRPVATLGEEADEVRILATQRVASPLVLGVEVGDHRREHVGQLFVVVDDGLDGQRDHRSGRYLTLLVNKGECPRERDRDQTPVGMEWEYLVQLVDNTDMNSGRLQHVLNWRSSQGWELVSLAPRVKPVMGQLQGGDVMAVFKRAGVGSFDPNMVEPPAF